jgi:hypothetical protein
MIFNAFKVGAHGAIKPTLVAFILAAAFPAHAFAQSNPWLGTWRANLAKSTYKVGPAPRSATLNFQGAGANLTDTAETLDATGKPTKSVFMHLCDGQSHPATGSPDFDARAYPRIDTNTLIYGSMKAGRLVAVGILLLSQDGRTIAGTTRGVNAAGQQLSRVVVYDKQ